jgi:hypothetical protein
MMLQSLKTQKVPHFEILGLIANITIPAMIKGIESSCPILIAIELSKLT